MKHIIPTDFSHSFFIPGNVPSLKNSKVMGKYMSKTCKNYIRSHGIAGFSARNGVTKYKKIPHTFENHIDPEFYSLKYPAWVGFHFVRDSRRAFDFHNAVQILADLFTAHRIIEDDNCRHFCPVPVAIDGNIYSLDKDNPGAWIYYD